MRTTARGTSGPRATSFRELCVTSSYATVKCWMASRGIANDQACLCGELHLFSRGWVRDRGLWRRFARILNDRLACGGISCSLHEIPWLLDRIVIDLRSTNQHLPDQRRQW